MTETTLQKERVNAMGVFSQIIIATMPQRHNLRVMGVHVCVELLVDGLEVSYKLPDMRDEQLLKMLRSVLGIVQDILWHSCSVSYRSRVHNGIEHHLYTCNGVWDIQWPELTHASSMTYDDGGREVWN